MFLFLISNQIILYFFSFSKKLSIRSSGISILEYISFFDLIKLIFPVVKINPYLKDDQNDLKVNNINDIKAIIKLTDNIKSQYQEVDRNKIIKVMYQIQKNLKENSYIL
ncbi:hypothetical protein [Candidatus Phytoplasma melaleucae]|uniref:Uncharacterized protein n=1 Tax=Candidatus Phytoplasma melaleucae TaxID=2982630 RepID=A0ABT9DD59_9MOLU|nr:hypothetical protein ['Melaleuca sp.' phytoplasma]MDO8168027.1 hypothetical protein ['Melaleuca sp.' phytoplasma]